MPWWNHFPQETIFGEEKHTTPHYPVNVVRAFISVSYENYHPLSEQAVQTPLEEIIQAFARRWGGLDEATFLRVLREATGRDRLAAIFAIGHSQFPQAGDTLAQLLTHTDQLIRFAAACCLGLRRDERALPILAEYLLTDPPVLEQDGITRIHPEAETWYETYAGLLPWVLANWGPASIVPVLRRAFLRVWRQEKEYQPGPSQHEMHDAIFYALGRRGACAAMHSIELPDYRSRLAAIYLALGELAAAERFEDLASEMITNATLKQEVAAVLARRFALTSKECQQMIDSWWDDRHKRDNWFEFREDNETSDMQQ